MKCHSTIASLAGDIRSGAGCPQQIRHGLNRGWLAATVVSVNPVLQALVDRGGGLLTRTLALQVVSRRTLESAIETGRLRRVLPEVYVDTKLIVERPEAGAGDNLGLLGRLEPEVRRRAVIAYADGQGCLSHTTALDVWGCRRQPANEPLHLSVPKESGMRSRIGLVVHHRREFAVQPPQVLRRRDLPVVRIERALVEAWPLLPPVDRPAPLIRAVNDRLSTPERIGLALAEVPKLTGRAELRWLLDRLAAGCRSALEIWGHDHVFTGANMPPFQRQVRVQVNGHTMYLDVYAERERVDFELDGATTHGDPRQREIDLRRDAALATVGILVVRFARRRLVYETADVRREILAILASRSPNR
jgi:very-short-patch-repair endonuclease